LRYQNNDQSVGLIPKWDPGIPGLQISQSQILGLRIQFQDCSHYLPQWNVDICSH